ncbi:MAG: DUF1343 domain-containing protein [Spirochaetales bacterium]|nr:DUF1343 domain-containing protein [Spirochaetales bacterium]
MSETRFRFGLETLLEQPADVPIYRAGYAFPGHAEPGGIGEPANAASVRDASGDAAGAVRYRTARASELSALLAGRRVAVLSHPAGVDAELTPGIDRLASWLAGHDRSGAPPPSGARLTALFGPQHGLRGEKQDNMVESEDYTDRATGLPAFSLYGTTRRITAAIADTFDVLLVDLQDVGVRVYTFLTTLAYILEDLAPRPEKEVWVLDRPNPTGRLVEGLSLEAGHESFVGVASIPMQHGFTLGEFALWYRDTRGLATRLTVVPMTGWNPAVHRDAWPADRVWVQPSPNMPGLYTTRAYPGTVILEGTTLSEGRGTTRPLSVMGHPGVDWDAVLDWVRSNTSEHRSGEPGEPDRSPGPCGEDAAGAKADHALAGCRVRRLTFQPTFHKHANIPTAGIDIVAEGRFWDPERFRPYRLVAAVLKAIRTLHPDIELWSPPPYEYEFECVPVDVITGGMRFREWVDGATTTWADLSEALDADEGEWRAESLRWRLY